MSLPTDAGRREQLEKALADIALALRNPKLSAEERRNILADRDKFRTEIDLLDDLDRSGK